MNLIYRVVVAILILAPCAALVYKTQVLKLSVIPKEISDEWSVHLTIDPLLDSDTRLLPIPQELTHQEISQVTVHPSPLDYDIKESDDGLIVQWYEDHVFTGQLGYEFRARLRENVVDLPQSVGPRHRLQYKKEYLKVPSLSSAEAARISQLESAILEPGLPLIESLKRIFFYVSEEVRISPSTTSIVEALDMGRGSAATKARIFDILIRRAGIPSRINVGIRLQKNPELRPARNRYRLSFVNEVYLGTQWYAVDLTRRTLGINSDIFLTLHRNIEHLAIAPEAQPHIAVYAVPLRANRYNANAYTDELRRTDSIFYKLSLYSLPLSMQNPLYIILLLPLGAVTLSFFRNIIGIQTFGVFTPILLTIFFMETPFLLAVSFFALVVVFGFSQRILLDKLYLLAVPRLSILLTLVIITYVLFIVLNHHGVFGFSTIATLSYFPVVIITVLIERFSIDFIEEGAANTFTTLLGTCIIAFFCYLIFNVELIRTFLFTNPEFLLATIGVNLLIGNYKGYRLSEFARFRELAARVG